MLRKPLSCLNGAKGFKLVKFPYGQWLSGFRLKFSFQQAKELIKDPQIP